MSGTGVLTLDPLVYVGCGWNLCGLDWFQWIPQIFDQTGSGELADRSICRLPSVVPSLFKCDGANYPHGGCFFYKIPLIRDSSAVFLSYI